MSCPVGYTMKKFRTRKATKGADTLTSICNRLSVPLMEFIQGTKIGRSPESGASRLSSSSECLRASAFICLGEEMEYAEIERKRSLLFIDRPSINEYGTGNLEHHRNSSMSEHLTNAASHSSSKRSWGSEIYGTTTIFRVNGRATNAERIGFLLTTHQTFSHDKPVRGGGSGLAEVLHTVI